MSEKRDRKRGGESATKATVSSSPMDVELLARIVALMTSHDLNTVDVRDGDRRVILKRGVQPAPRQAAGENAHAAAAVARPTASTAATAGGATPADEEAGYVRITSPMVGTFYAAPKPGEKPFVSVGSVVTEDTDVCIIEAMKTFNNIKAECRGAIARIIMQDGQPVEFGTVLFLVKPG